MRLSSERAMLIICVLALLINATAFSFMGIAIIYASNGGSTAVSQTVETAQTAARQPTAVPSPILPTTVPTATPTPYPTPTLKPTPAPTQPVGIEHTIGADQTLWGIANLYYGSGQAWPTLLEANPAINGRDELVPGDKLFVPRPAGGIPNTVTTPAPPEVIPIRASYYTLEPIGLSDAENVNCNDDCSNLALARFDPRMYGRVAACPPEWVGTVRTVKLTVEGLGSFYCLDTGTLIKLTYREVSGYGREPLWVYEVDFLQRTEPAWHGRLFYGWSLEWIPTEQARRESVAQQGLGE